jgi:transposase
MDTFVRLLAAVPPEIAGLPTWALNGLSIGSLVGFILVGLGTSRLWTKSQVDIVRADHTKAVEDLNKVHDREVGDLKARYETHLTRTVELYKGRVEDALTREREWRDVAQQWQQVAGMLGQGIEPMQEQSETILRILEAWQSESRRKGDGP